MAYLFSKTELVFIEGSREFTNEQARVIRYRIRRKMKASNDDNDNNTINHLPKQTSRAVFGTFALRKWRQKRRRR
jgi:hypothetical protein